MKKQRKADADSAHRFRHKIITTRLAVAEPEKSAALCYGRRPNGSTSEIRSTPRLSLRGRTSYTCMEICGAVGCSAWLDAPYSTRKRACLSSLRQSLAHNVSKILAAGFGRFNNSPKIVPVHGKQFNICLGANRSVSTCFGQEPNLPEVIARMKNR